MVKSFQRPLVSPVKMKFTLTQWKYQSNVWLAHAFTATILFPRLPYEMSRISANIRRRQLYFSWRRVFRVNKKVTAWEIKSEASKREIACIARSRQKAWELVTLKMQIVDVVRYYKLRQLENEVKEKFADNVPMGRRGPKTHNTQQIGHL